MPLGFIFIGLTALELARLVRPIKIKPDASHRAFILFAVKGGFEPPEQFPVRQFSKLLVSATHPPHQSGVQIYNLSNFFQTLR